MIRFFVALLVLLFVSNKAQSNDSIVVYVFLLESCPICQQQTPVLQELYETFSESGIAFVGLFPNSRVSNAATMDSFRLQYGLTFELQSDANHYFKEKFEATITPEIVVYHKYKHEVLYRGKIDNRFERVGVRRQVVTENYLYDALNEILNNQPVTISNTAPVGCLIMRKPN